MTVRRTIALNQPAGASVRRAFLSVPFVGILICAVVFRFVGRTPMVEPASVPLEVNQSALLISFLAGAVLIGLDQHRLAHAVRFAIRERLHYSTATISSQPEPVRSKNSNGGRTCRWWRVGKLTGRVSWDSGSQRSSAASRSPDRRGRVRVQD
jgi:hypothetical protein